MCLMRCSLRERHRWDTLEQSGGGSATVTVTSCRWCTACIENAYSSLTPNARWRWRTQLARWRLPPQVAFAPPRRHLPDRTARRARHLFPAQLLCHPSSWRLWTGAEWSPVARAERQRSACWRCWLPARSRCAAIPQECGWQFTSGPALGARHPAAAAAAATAAAGCAARRQGLSFLGQPSCRLMLKQGCLRQTTRVQASDIRPILSSTIALPIMMVPLLWCH